MGKKKTSDEPVFGPQLLKNPVVQKALADMAVAAVLAIAARIEGSKPVQRAEGEAGRDLEKVARKVAEAVAPKKKKAKAASKPKKAKPAA